jgi:hypothetical protein
MCSVVKYWWKGNQESLTMSSMRKEACSEAAEDREAILNGG